MRRGGGTGRQGPERRAAARRWIPLGASGAIALAALAAACAGPTRPGTAGPTRTRAGGEEPAPIQAGRAAPAGTYGDVDVIHYEAVVGLPGPGGVSVDGSATLTLRPTREGVRAAVLDLSGLAVLDVRVDGTQVEARHADGRLTVPLPAGAGPADTLTVLVDYAGTPDDGLILGNDVHGRAAAFVDNWPNRARFWLPSVDHPSDKATVTLTMHAQDGWRVVGNGVPLVSGEPGPPAPDGAPRVTWTWSTSVPISTYNMVFGGARFEILPLGLAACGAAPVSPRSDGCVEVSAWLYPEDTAQARTSFRRAAEMADFYTDLVGPYPFEKLAHVQAATRFGGMENASAIFYSERALASGRDIEGTVSHETAHQWFGDSVTEADWPELWLAEGFATYFGYLFFEHADGVADFRRRMEEDRRRVLASRDVVRPVIDRGERDLFALLNDNNYGKGAWVLHMLRGLVGDDAFFRGIRTWYRRSAGSISTTDDLRRALEEVSGQSLDWYFRQWLEEPGYPVLQVAHRWDASAGEIVLTARQLQDAAWPTFRVPLDVELRLDGGSVVRRRIELTEREQTFHLPATGPAREVVLDPDVRVLFEGVPDTPSERATR